MKYILAAIVIAMLGHSCKPMNKLQVQSVQSAIVRNHKVFNIQDKLIVVLMDFDGIDHLIIKCEAKSIRLEFIMTSLLSCVQDEHGFMVSTYLVKRMPDGLTLTLRTVSDDGALQALWLGDGMDYFYINILTEYFS
jgi:hypothetical protein